MSAPDSMPAPVDLSLVDTRELVKAIRSRFPGGFLLVTDWQPEDGCVHPVVSYGPDVGRAIFLSHFASIQVHRDLMGIFEP